jgi:type IV secretory pathway VirB10-like protein
MKSRFMAFGALALACILAAGGGAYLAVRHQATGPAQAASQAPAAVVAPGNQGTPAALAMTPPAATYTPPAAKALSPVQESTAASTAVAHEAERPSRRGRVERRTPSAVRDTDEAKANAAQQDGSNARPGAVGDPAGQPTSTSAQPQSVNQPPAEPQREWVEVTVPAESVLGLQIQTAVSSETARVEDRVEARVTRDIRIDDRVAIPAGSQAIGSVVQVERGGKLKDRAHFAIRFNSLVLPDGTRLALTAEAVHREGPSPANKSAARIGGATVGGAILGAILGGGKGAAIGGAIGAGGGTAATMASDREPATLPAGSIVNIRLMSPVSVTLER